MKRKVLFLIVAIVGILATVNLTASSGSRGVCVNSGWGCKAVCPECGSWFKGTSGRLGPGVITVCGNCGHTDPIHNDGEQDEDFDMD